MLPPGPYEELEVEFALNGRFSYGRLQTLRSTIMSSRGAELAGLRNELRHDSVLQELARAPLMLNLLCAAYRGHGARDLAVRKPLRIGASISSRPTSITFSKHGARRRSPIRGTGASTG